MMHQCVRVPGRASTCRACASGVCSPVTASASSAVIRTTSLRSSMVNSAAARSPLLNVQARGPAPRQTAMG